MSEAPRRVRVLVADDQPVAIAGTAHHLAQNGVEVCGIVEELRRLEPVYEVQRPDLVLVETSMGGRGEALQAVEELLRAHRDALVLAFTADLSLGMVEAALDAGCRGVVPKTATVEALLQAIGIVAQGDRHLHPRAVALLLGRKRDPAPSAPVVALSARERTVLELMAEGLTNRVIGERLGISETTVKTHVAHLLRKLGATDRAHAVGRGLRSGLIA